MAHCRTRADAEPEKGEADEISLPHALLDGSDGSPSADTVSSLSQEHSTLCASPSIKDNAAETRDGPSPSRTPFDRVFCPSRTRTSTTPEAEVERLNDALRVAEEGRRQAVAESHAQEQIAHEAGEDHLQAVAEACAHARRAATAEEGRIRAVAESRAQEQRANEAEKDRLQAVAEARAHAQRAAAAEATTLRVLEQQLALANSRAQDADRWLAEAQAARREAEREAMEDRAALEALRREAERLKIDEAVVNQAFKLPATGTPAQWRTTVPSASVPAVTDLKGCHHESTTPNQRATLEQRSGSVTFVQAPHRKEPPWHECSLSTHGSALLVILVVYLKLAHGVSLASAHPAGTSPVSDSFDADQLPPPTRASADTVPPALEDNAAWMAGVGMPLDFDGSDREEADDLDGAERESLGTASRGCSINPQAELMCQVPTAKLTPPVPVPLAPEFELKVAPSIRSAAALVAQHAVDDSTSFADPHIP
ncbi:uncharacterized protein BXZ73DRAFT_105840 [Epithele typhae]|uniref:uncharacterized protein n=1 Tax=Epithele typhae TaxID=378194 RepID=UPI0020081974|nr:uncharacterized protein BXZ73DRAFT_105840 [Epithele typhae]KAH9916401.1 hypothetical protein BXZ73DRAFT_105840 [Epithele typhae]